MRTNNSIRNSIVALVSNFLSILIALIAQSIFIKILGIEYLGLNGLFTNILTMLSIFELGIGSAIIYNLYEPIATNNIEKIKSIMKFYKKTYNLIAIIILLVGILMIPFLKTIVGEVSVDINIYVIYVLFLISTLTSYIIAYKRNLIYANQKNYIVDLIHMCYLIILNILQLIILYFTKQYYIYLLIKIICQLFENIIITLIANKMYPYLLDEDIKILDKKIEKDIFSKVKALVFHKVGAIIINGTDNIIISMYLGVAQVGIYTNYYTIINAVKTVFSQVISSTTASIGNLLVTENEEKIYDVFKKMRFLNFWIACFSGISILIIIQPFISIWVGEEYKVSMFVVIILVLNFYQKMMRISYASFKESAGIYIEDKFIPLIESCLNIISSIILLKIFGLAGVFMGTIISGLTIWCYSYPKFVYKKLFNRTYYNYAKETLGYLILFIIITFITFSISKMIIIKNYYLQILINAITALIIPNLIIVIIFRKTDNFKYFTNLLNELLKEYINKKRE